MKLRVVFILLLSVMAGVTLCGQKSNKKIKIRPLKKLEYLLSQPE